MAHDIFIWILYFIFLLPFPLYENIFIVLFKAKKNHNLSNSIVSTKNEIQIFSLFSRRILTTLLSTLKVISILIFDCFGLCNVNTCLT